MENIPETKIEKRKAKGAERTARFSLFGFRFSRPLARGSLFARLWLRALTVKRPQALVALVSLAVGAAVTSMLLNLHGDVRRKMAEEFRAYGANATLAPRATAAAGAPALLDAKVLGEVAGVANEKGALVAVPVLHSVVRAIRVPADPRLPEFHNAVAVGTDFAALRALYPGWRLAGEAHLAPSRCVVGERVARALALDVGGRMALEPLGREATEAVRAECEIAGVLTTGAAEDDQVFLPLESLQRLAGAEGRISLVELSVPGETREIEQTLAQLSAALPGVEVRPIRQIVYSEGKVLEIIRWLLVALTALILAIIALSVTATMTAIVLERQKDIAVMKALGARDRLVSALLLGEGAALGLAGGVGGFALGLLLARDAAARLFGVSLTPAWWTLPLVSLATMALAALASLAPVRIARAVRPATLLKGE